ncbi:hypothetical protein A7U60_g7956 [Sanghuangporus baumii]|uniref:PH domain-containing protein n=1 Tax=Sanghuangporus baumii TaxID=108892 RepID=A0A9Q5HS87_SANBA|nr:hypothetical protein A7U60_g7956 [Sanghuangporus baumii]
MNGHYIDRYEYHMCATCWPGFDLGEDFEPVFCKYSELMYKTESNWKKKSCRECRDGLRSVTRLRLQLTAATPSPPPRQRRWLSLLYSFFHPPSRPGSVQMNQDASPVLPLPSSSVSSAPANHALAHRRIFLGPMPYTVSKTEDQEKEATDFVSQHGLRIFLQQGGRIEEWTEAKAREYKERLKQRILESAAWHAVVGKKGKKKGVMPTVEWRGDTFEIGKVAGVGVNMLATSEETTPRLQDTRRSSDRSTRSRRATTVHWDDLPRPSFVTARTTLTSIASPGGVGSPRLQASQGAPLPSDSSDANGEANEPNESTSSSTHLFTEMTSQSITRQDLLRTSGLRGAKSEGDLPKKARTGLKSILNGPGKDKGKGKTVRYADTPRRGAPSGSQRPVPPDEVLERSPAEVEDSSAAAAAEANEWGFAVASSDGDDNNGPVVRRDRMLVRIFRCEHEGLKIPFIDKECRRTRGLDSKEWGEFLVIWRNRRLELYEDYHTPCKERILGHKHLAFVIPLTSLRTKLSLFSFIDMSFCLICPPTPTKSKEDKGRRSIFHHSTRGLNVFVLKPKSSSRALDWIWNLWIELGAALPDHIEISCPLVHARVTLPVPDGGAGWREVTRDFVIDECSEAMEGSFAWQTVIQLPILNGRRLELCWRLDTRLDWVWLKNDVDGRKRDWEILFGAAISRLGSPTQLELHIASHYPTTITTRDGNHLEEPPSIEGYVHSYNRKTQARVQYYLSTHDGYLFAIRNEKVVAPPIPTDLKSFAKSEVEFREDERVRLREQIVNARWLWDMRNVLLVRRAMHVIHQVKDPSITANRATEPPDPDANVLEQAQEPHNGSAEFRRTDSDIDDEGGDAGLAASADKARLKMRRSFEIVLKNGRILRFETHSTKIAVEWVTHLRALVQYWAKRYRQDTVNEMKIKESLVEERITISKRDYKNGYRRSATGADVENTTLHLDEFWNWCVLDGCRQILKSGRVYMKKKYRAQYIQTHLILTRGFLVQFRVKNDFSLHTHQMGRINLIDAYVCSGYYAALALPPDEYDPNSQPLTRYFPDGLETRDMTEDTLFLLWYCPHADVGKSDKGDSNKTPIRQMNSKRKLVFFRARSKLERDAWCWALNCEIERLVRETKDREYRIREQGTPVPL